MGFFAAPNTAQIMRSVPPEHRGSAAGMRATVLNAGMTASQAVFFSMVIGALAGTLGPCVRSGAIAAGLPSGIASGLATIPPGGAIFSALLGYDPISHVMPASALGALPPAILARVTDPHFFAGLLAGPFVGGIRLALSVSAAMCALAGVASALRGGAEVSTTPAMAVVGPGSIATTLDEPASA